MIAAEHERLEAALKSGDVFEEWIRSEFSNRNLTKYDPAFELLTGDSTWKQTSLIQRRALLHIVIDEEDQARDETFGVCELFEKQTMPLFVGYDTRNVVNCLNAIREIWVANLRFTNDNKAQKLRVVRNTKGHA